MVETHLVPVPWGLQATFKKCIKEPALWQVKHSWKGAWALQPHSGFPMLPRLPQTAGVFPVGSSSTIRVQGAGGKPMLAASGSRDRALAWGQ